MSCITITDLSVKYGHEEVLSNISCTIEAGDFLAVIGPNGSGKTTFVKTLVGLIKPDSGSVRFDCTNGTPFRIGYLPQRSTYTDPRFPASVMEVVASGTMSRSVYHIPENEKKHLAVIMELLDITHLASNRVGLLSGGQQQRVHLARALASSPSLLILDEPTGALDPETRDCFYKTLTEFNSENGMTIIMVTHDSHSVESFARSILFLDRTMLYYGSIADFNTSISAKHYFTHRHG